MSTALVGPYRTGVDRSEIHDPMTASFWHLERSGQGWRFTGPGLDWSAAYPKSEAIARCKEAAEAYRAKALGLAPAEGRGNPGQSRAASRGTRPTSADLRHFERVRALGCAVADEQCRGPLEIHHVRLVDGERRKHDQVIALCVAHHREGGHGVAFHAGQETWEDRYAPIEDVLEHVRDQLTALAEVDA